MHLIYKLLYVILHTISSFLEYIAYFWSCVKRKITATRKQIVGFDDSVQCVYNEVKTLNKKPVHLTIILNEEDNILQDVTNVIIWCIAAGISFISFHDSRGYLRKREQDLQMFVKARIKDGEHVIWHGRKRNHKNGFVGKKIHIKLLTENDGRDSVVKLSKQLALCENQKDINIGTVETYLNKQFEFPEPDLGICCGKAFCVYGYPPWQIRVTEFLNLRTFKSISVQNFIDLLRRFSRCEQRLGK